MWRCQPNARTIIIAVLLVWIRCESLVTRIPPKALTEGRMSVTKRRILQYAQTNDRLPQDLIALPEMPGFDTTTNDAWGYPIQYSIGEDGSVTLTSLGSDGKPGGSGDAADLVHRFLPKQPDGKSSGMNSWNGNRLRLGK